MYESMTSWFSARQAHAFARSPRTHTPSEYVELRNVNVSFFELRRLLNSQHIEALTQY